MTEVELFHDEFVIPFPCCGKHSTNLSIFDLVSSLIYISRIPSSFFFFLFLVGDRRSLSFGDFDCDTTTEVSERSS